MGRAKSADNNVLFRSHIYIPVQSDHPNLSLTENGSDIHKVQRCKECIFWHFCGTGLFWTPHGQVFFNSPANTCRQWYLFSHFTALALVGFILHWCCRSISNCCSLLFPLKGKMNNLVRKNFCCLPITGRVLYSTSPPQQQKTLAAELRNCPN